MYDFSPPASATPALRRPRHLVRSALTWLAATLAALLGGAAALAELLPVLRTLAERRAVPFDRLLVAGCGSAALLAVLALWAVTTEVVHGVVTDRPPRCRSGRLGPVRALVLAACGVAVLATATPATADTVPGPRSPGVPSLDGLPLPDRATGGPVHRTAEVRRTPPPLPPPAREVVVVRPGDSLWGIAADRLGAAATAADVAAYWHRLHRLNADVIGDDPDLVLPGQRLRLPPLT